MRDIDEIVEFEIVQKIDTKIRVKTASSVVDGLQTLTFCNQKYLRLFRKLYFGETEIVVKSNDGLNVIIETTVPIAVNSILNIPLPFYHRGTPRALNSIWNDLSTDEREKLPAIWLLNPVDEAWKSYGDIDRVSEVTLFFMCEADFNNDLTKELRKKNVFPMIQLSKAIEKAIEQNKLWFNPLNGYKTRDYSVFGTEDKNGMIANIIDSDLSGLSMGFSLEILKENCKC